MLTCSVCDTSIFNFDDHRDFLFCFGHLLNPCKLKKTCINLMSHCIEYHNFTTWLNELNAKNIYWNVVMYALLYTIIEAKIDAFRIIAFAFMRWHWPRNTQFSVKSHSIQHTHTHRTFSNTMEMIGTLLDLLFLFCMKKIVNENLWCICCVMRDRHTSRIFEPFYLRSIESISMY